ncbi:MAG: hypothetical protein LLG02_08055 [Pelosinus sp.]|nr:hypothetical protein [Pelosinus sp.]
MSIKSNLKEVEDLVRDFKNKDKNGRSALYTTILTVLDRIEESVKDQSYPNYSIYKSDLLEACELLCSSAEHNDDQEARYIGGAIATIRKMGSIACFNVDNHYI